MTCFISLMMTLSEFFLIHPNVVVAYSGGIDSTYLLYAAQKYAQNVRAIFVRSAFQPAFECADALSFCHKIGLELEFIDVDVFMYEEIVSNSPNRCYYCKRAIFGAICDAAHTMPGFDVLDGTNVDDDETDRPGMKALRELGVLSPLRLCGMTKAMIREAAKKADIGLWNKPAYACLATRMMTGERLTREQLEKTEQAEAYLMTLGFEDFRIRCVGNTAKIQIKSEDFVRLMALRNQIRIYLKQYYENITLDLKARDE